MSGWRRRVPVAAQGASSSTPSAGASGRQKVPSAFTGSALRPSRVQVRDQLAEPLARALDGGHLGAGGGQLRRLAAGRGAEVDDPLAGDVSEQPGR